MNTPDVKENLHSMIDHAFSEMDELKNRAARSSADLRSRIQSDMQSLETKKQELKTKMVNLRNAAEDKREQISEAVEASADSFREGLNRLAWVFNEEPMVRK